MEVRTKVDVISLLRQDDLRWQALGFVDLLRLPAGCIGAGFVRNLVWDHLHGQSSDCRHADIDVLWHDSSKVDAGYDLFVEDELRTLSPDLNWSVKNQARMHLRNGDEPYASVEAAMRSWPETATAVAASRDGDHCKIIAPFGLDDLFTMTLRPTSPRPDKILAFEQRVREKQWLSRWPQATLAP